MEIFLRVLTKAECRNFSSLLSKFQGSHSFSLDSPMSVEAVCPPPCASCVRKTKTKAVSNNLNTETTDHKQNHTWNSQYYLFLTRWHLACYIPRNAVSQFSHPKSALPASWAMPQLQGLPCHQLCSPASSWGRFEEVSSALCRGPCSWRQLSQHKPDVEVTPHHIGDRSQVVCPSAPELPSARPDHSGPQGFILHTHQKYEWEHQTLAAKYIKFRIKQRNLCWL